MPKTVLVLNNPASILILFTTLRTDVDEVWVETGASEKFDSMLERAVSVLQLDRELPVHRVKVEHLFGAGRAGWSKIKDYRKIASEVTSVCQNSNVETLICSTTSSFRLANVDALHIVDHGTGDYLRSPIKTRIEQLKYSMLYASLGKRSFSYYAFLPLPDRITLPLDLQGVRDKLREFDHPFTPEKTAIVMLVDPRFSLEEQRRRLHFKMGNTSYDLYLKGHHFDTRSHTENTMDLAGLPVPKPLPYVLDALPAELIMFGIDASLSLVAFESSALWNIGFTNKEKVFSLAKRTEIMDIPAFKKSKLLTLEKNLNYYPFC